MPSVITHSLVGLAVGKIFFIRKMSRFFWDLTIVCALIPDIDVISFRLGIPYGDFWGHRGFTHSLFFALLVGLTVAAIFIWRERRPWGRYWFFSLYFTVVCALNGVLDAMTNGGHGVALLAPFDDTRYFLPWRPIEVSPLTLKGFLTERGLEVIGSEIVWVWIPLVLLIVLSRLLRRPPRRT